MKALMKIILAAFISINFIFVLMCCDIAQISEVEENSREYIQFEQFHVEKNFIHADTALRIVFRSKEDEITFFEEHPIQSRFPFPEINYEHNDVVGICRGKRDARGAYVTIDSVILNEQREIQVYSTEYDYETEFPVENHPITFASIPKFELSINFGETYIQNSSEPITLISYETLGQHPRYIHSDTLVTVIINAKSEEIHFFKNHPIRTTVPFPEINYDKYNLIIICYGEAPTSSSFIKIDKIVLVNQSEIFVLSTYHYSQYGYCVISYPQQFALIPKYGLPINFRPIELKYYNSKGFNQ